MEGKPTEAEKEAEYLEIVYSDDYERAVDEMEEMVEYGIQAREAAEAEIQELTGNLEHANATIAQLTKTLEDTELAKKEVEAVKRDIELKLQKFIMFHQYNIEKNEEKKKIRRDKYAAGGNVIAKKKNAIKAEGKRLRGAYIEDEEDDDNEGKDSGAGGGGAGGGGPGEATA